MPAIYEDRKKVFDNIKILVKSEYEEIYKIIAKKKEQFTENSNGIFFDLMLIKDDTFNEIKYFLDFCLKTRQDDIQRQKELDTIRNENELYETNETNETKC
jgi:hypothetical protein